MALSPGTRFGPYEIVSLLGAGGMGVVYRARDARLNRDVAIKVLPESVAADPERLARFEREARTLAALNHPNIAHIHGFEESTGVPALVMELVEGPTLADRIALGPIPLDSARRIARQIAEALDAAHERGIVHRDLKPANIKVREDGAVKLLDFGLAKALEPEPGAPAHATALPTLTSPAMTAMGVVLGTAAYMSPEQARGQTIDRRTDIWAFGCVLYEMLTARRAFDRPSVADTAAAILEREPDWSALPAATPVSMRRLLERCVEKDRKQRLRDIGDARYELDAINSAGTDNAGEPARAGRFSRAVMLGAGVVVVAAIVAIAFVVMRPRNSGPAEAASSSLGPQLARVTFDDSYSTEPALSRDGTVVVYASDRAGDGQLDLWLQRTAGGQPIRLTSDPSDDRAPTFSPDGSLIAFRSDRGTGGVYVMPTLGGDQRLIAEGGRGPRFSPDGARIAYWTGSWLTGQGRRATGYAVFIVPATGGTSERVVPGFVTAREPLWSPDGRSLLVFGRKSADNSASASFDWWWIPLDGREPVATGAYRVLAQRGLVGSDPDEPGQVFDAIAGAWTPAGVLFSARLGESINLWRLDVSERTGAAAETSLTRLTFGPGFDVSPTVNDSGRVAFQVNAEGAVSLMLPLDSNAGKATGPVVRQTFDAGAVGRNTLDAAGRLLVYSKHRATESEIWVKDLVSRRERHLVTVTPASAIDPVISRDGEHVGYAVWHGPNVAGFVVASAGGSAKKVCDDCTLHGWFSDGRRTLALDRTGNQARAIDITDGTATNLLSSVRGRLDLSPDDRWISFGARGQVWIAPIRPREQTPENEWVPILAQAEGSAERACGWSPDGGLLYLLLERDGFRDLYAQRIDRARGRPAGDPFVVQHLHDPRRRWGSTPLGTAIVSNWFVFNQVEMTGSIWLLNSSVSSR